VRILLEPSDEPFLREGSGGSGGVVGSFSYQGEKGRLERMMPIGGVGLPERERAGASGLGWIPDFGPQVWPSWLPFSFFFD
jgi:hypothetical protein